MFYCDKCGKPATNLTWVEINGTRMEQHLCGDCARTEKSLGEIIEPMVGEFFDFPVAFARKKPSNHMPVCPTCGYSAQDFINSGIFNCPDCFRVFSGLKPRINVLDDTPAPIEKVKLNKRNEFSYLDSLKAKLETAVKEERYKDAAELKQKIDEIEKSKGEK